MADTLAARVAAVQALAAAATPGPWLIDERVRCAAIVAPAEVDSPGLGRDYAGVLAFWMPSQRWHYQHEDKPLTVWDPPRANMEMMAAAPDLVALVTDLWGEVETAQRSAAGWEEEARLASVNYADWQADASRLTRERDEARAEAARLRALLTRDFTAWGEHCAGLGEPTTTEEPTP